MQATSIDYFEESHIFQGMKQDPRKKEAIMHMSQFLQAKSSLVARAFLPYMPGSRNEFICPYIVTIRSIPVENTIILGVRGLLSLSILKKLQDERPSVLQRLEKNYVLRTKDEAGTKTYCPSWTYKSLTLAREIAGGNSILHLRHVRPQHVLGPAARLTKAP